MSRKTLTRELINIDSEIESKIDDIIPSDITVLVTGANGYIASVLIKILIDDGFNVRGTVRGSINDSRYDFLYNISNTNRIELYQCNLLEPNNWDHAINGCQYVFHVASPVGKLSESQSIKNHEYYVDPPTTGIKYILDACKKYNIKRVIYTSSSSTCMINITSNMKVSKFDTAFWTDITDIKVHKYTVGKVRTEEYFWWFIKENNMEGVSLHPGSVIGPLIPTFNGNEPPVSLFHGIISQLCGYFPTLLMTTFVDVRSVARAHINAILKPKSIVNGKRYLLISNVCSNHTVSQILYKKYKNKYGTNIKPYSDTYLWFKSYFVPYSQGKQLRINIQRNYLINNQPSISELGVKYYDFEKSVIDSAESLINLGLIKENKNNKQIIKKILITIGIVGLSGLILYKYGNPFKSKNYVLIHK